MKNLLTGWHIGVWQDYGAFFFPRRHNWMDFTFIHLQFEGSPYKDSAEVNFALLGFHLNITKSWYSEIAERERRKVEETLGLSKT